MELKLFYGLVRRHKDHTGFHVTILAFDKVEAMEYIQNEVKQFLPDVSFNKIEITEITGPFKSGRVICRIIL